MKALISILFALSGLGLLGVGSGDPTNPSTLGIGFAVMSLVSAIWYYARSAGFVFLGAGFFVVFLGIVGVMNNLSGLDVPEGRLSSAFVRFALNGGISAILALFACSVLLITEWKDLRGKLGELLWMVAPIFLALNWIIGKDIRCGFQSGMGDWCRLHTHFSTFLINDLGISHTSNWPYYLDVSNPSPLHIFLLLIIAGFVIDKYVSKE